MQFPTHLTSHLFMLSSLSALIFRSWDAFCACEILALSSRSSSLCSRSSFSIGACASAIFASRS